MKRRALCWRAAEVLVAVKSAAVCADARYVNALGLLDANLLRERFPPFLVPAGVARSTLLLADSKGDFCASGSLADCIVGFCAVSPV
jgi:hypothetical protein